MTLHKDDDGACSHRAKVQPSMPGCFLGGRLHPAEGDGLVIAKRGYVRPSLHSLLMAATHPQQFVPGMHKRMMRPGVGWLLWNPPFIVRCVNGPLEGDAVLSE